MGDELPEGALGVGEATTAVAGDSDEAGSVRGAVDEIFIVDAAVGGGAPLAIGPGLAKVGGSDVGATPRGKGGVVR